MNYNFLQNIYDFLQSRKNTRFVSLILIDSILFSLAALITFWLQSTEVDIFYLFGLNSFLPIAIVLGILIYYLTGQYTGLSKYVGSQSLYRLVARNAIFVSLLYFISYLFRLPLISLRVIFQYWIILSVLTGTIRFILRDLLLSIKPNYNKLKNVAIYGAGKSGAQLARALKFSDCYKVDCFIDDDDSLLGRNLNGTPIKSLNSLNKSTYYDHILLSIPSISRTRLRDIVLKLNNICASVLEIPTLEEISSGVKSIDQLRPISIENLLSREIVVPYKELMGPGIEGQSVCVTGAGGSIGSELCMQILIHKPNFIILIDMTEASLYSICLKLSKIASNNNCRIISILGNVCDETLVRQVFIKYNVNIVFHAAAYKHVPLVELNPVEGIRNNLSSTFTICKIAEEINVNKVILISSDKAVRPTNVMGATKRLCELVFQSFGERYGTSDSYQTIFAMVRFGNVLGSSGSVVPLFKDQISLGGPITLTHPDVVRYFMTITEAAQLVMQASVLAKGGDLFLLDMGEPVRIVDLARQMIGLSGLTVKDELNPSGDIEIINIGLRPGEKLYEELLIDGKSSPTRHPLIFRALERSISFDEILPKIEELMNALSIRDKSKSFSIILDLVPEWVQSKTN